MTRFLSVIIIVVLVICAYYFLNPSSLVQPHDNQNEITATELAQWHEYSAPYGQFKVYFPSLPHHATQSLPDPKTKEMRNYEIFVANKDDGSNYSISIISFPHKEHNFDNDFLQNFISDSLMTNAQNKLKTIELKDYKKGKAVDFNLENGELAIFGKAFMDGKALYVLSSTSKIGNHNTKEYDFFINSFQLTPKASSQQGENLK